MPSYTIDGNDDIIAGTPDADTVAGTTGGNDQIDLGGGDDVATIDRIAFFIYDLVDPVNDYWEYFYTGMDLPFQGVLAGGAGRDTLDVGMRTDPPNASVNDFRVEPFSLRETELSGFEVLNTRWQTEISVAQLAGFDVRQGRADRSEGRVDAAGQQFGVSRGVAAEGHVEALDPGVPEQQLGCEVRLRACAWRTKGEAVGPRLAVRDQLLHVLEARLRVDDQKDRSHDGHCHGLQVFAVVILFSV